MTEAPGNSPEWEEMMAPLRIRYKTAPPIQLDEDGMVIPYEPPEEAPPFVVTSSTTDVDPNKFSKSPKGVWQKTNVLDWETRFIQTVTHHEAAYMKRDGKPKKDGSRAMKGDLKKPAHDLTHLFMLSFDREKKVGFIASWLGTSFEGATCVDPVGFPIELWANYEVDKETAKGLGAEKAANYWRRRDEAYNDRKWWIHKKKYMSTFSEFSSFLDEWVGIALQAEEIAA